MSGTPVLRFNADALVTDITDVIPIVEDVALFTFFAPDYGHAINRLEHGTVDIGNSTVPVMHVPHTLLYGILGKAKVNVYVVFPTMYNEDEHNLPFLSADKQAMFVDEVFLLATKDVLGIEDPNNFPASYRNCIKEGSQFFPLNMTQSEDANTITGIMRTIIDDNDHLACFKQFKYKTVSFGFEEKLVNCDLKSILRNIID